MKTLRATVSQDTGTGKRVRGCFIASPIMQGLERAGTTARCATALPNGRACSRVVRALSRRKGPQYVLKTGQRKMSEIIDDYEIAFERYGRPKGPFEKGRQCGYSAVATAKPGPAVDQGNQEPPPDDPPSAPPEHWWDQ